MGSSIIWLSENPPFILTAGPRLQTFKPGPTRLYWTAVFSKFCSSVNQKKMWDLLVVSQKTHSTVFTSCNVGFPTCDAKSLQCNNWFNRICSHKHFWAHKCRIFNAGALQVNSFELLSFWMKEHGSFMIIRNSECSQICLLPTSERSSGTKWTSFRSSITKTQTLCLG